MTLKDEIVRFFEARGLQYYPKNSLLKVPSKANLLCETEIKKDSFDARSSIVKINVVTVEYLATRAGSEEGRLFSQAN